MNDAISSGNGVTLELGGDGEDDMKVVKRPDVPKAPDAPKTPDVPSKPDIPKADVPNAPETPKGAPAVSNTMIILIVVGVLVCCFGTAICAGVAYCIYGSG